MTDMNKKTGRTRPASRLDELDAQAPTEAEIASFAANIVGADGQTAGPAMTPRQALMRIAARAGKVASR